MAELDVSYDETIDVLTVEGNQFSGQLFREWQDPDPKKLFSFERGEDGVLVVTEHAGLGTFTNQEVA